MAQFVRPDADILITSWLPGVGSTAWDLLDEGAPGNEGTDTVRSPSNPVYDTSELVLRGSDVTDPAVSTGHIIRAKWQKTGSGGRTIEGRLQLRQGYVDETTPGTLIATLTAADLPDTFQTNTYTLSAGEADSITDYNDLSFRCNGNFGGSGGARGLRIDYVELETPDAVAVEVIPRPMTVMSQAVHQSNTW